MNGQGVNNGSICKKIDNYVFKFNDLLGQGNFSKVYKGVHEISKQTVAIKVIQLNSLKSKKLEELLFSEIDVLKKLNHPNILKCHEVFSSNRNCYIITQICNGGDLETKLRSSRYFSESQATPYIFDVFKGLRYLAQNHVIHRDLKVANIFLDNKTAKIADFGFAKFTKQNFKDINIGSPIYMSPEGLLQNVYGPKTDVWAFGIFIFELLHGKTPFSHCTSQIDLKKEIQIPISYSSLKSQISFDLRQVIIKCLQTSEEKRITIKELQQTNYFEKFLKKDNKQSIPLVPKRPHPVFSPQRRDIKKRSQLQHHSLDKNRFAIRSFHVGSNFVNNNSSQGTRTNSIFPHNNDPKIGLSNPFSSSGGTRPYSAQKKPHEIQVRGRPGEINVGDRNSNNFLGSPKKLHTVQVWDQKPSFTNKNNIQNKPMKQMKTSGMVSILPGIINFKQSVNTLHYCRLLYKYLVMARQANPDCKNRKYYKILASWMFKILSQISQKVERKQIVYDEQTTKKQMKLREVTNEYYKKYSVAIERPFDGDANFESIISESTAKVQQYDSLQLYRPEMSINLHLAYFLIMIIDATKLLKKCSMELRFWEWSEYKQIEEFLSYSKNNFNYHGYLEIRRKVLK